jgi:hypothetical protein
VRYLATHAEGPDLRWHAAHVAAVLREQIVTWLLESEAAFNATSDAIVDVRDAFPRISDDAPSDEVARVALTALAAHLSDTKPAGDAE